MLFGKNNVIREVACIIVASYSHCISKSKVCLNEEYTAKFPQHFWNPTKIPVDLFDCDPGKYTLVYMNTYVASSLISRASLLLWLKPQQKQFWTSNV